MGVTLKVFGNHKMKFSSSQEGVSQFQQIFTKCPNEWNTTNQNEKKRTKELDEIIFSTNHNLLVSNFKNFGEIKIRTNFEFCSSISIIDKIIKYEPQGFFTKYSKWKKYLTKEYLNEVENVELMKLYNENWNRFRAFVLYITRLLNGDMVIYIDDHSYQIEEEILYNGGALEEFYQQLSKYQEPFELEALELFPNEPSVKDNTWYYEKLI